MPKEKKTSAEIELMIVDAVRAHRGCEDFRGISIYKIVDPSAAGVFNWSSSDLVAAYRDALKPFGDTASRAALHDTAARIYRLN